MLKLVNVNTTYEVVIGLADEPKENHPVFFLRKLSAGEVNSIDDQITVSRGDDSFAYLGGTAAELKIKYAVTGWRNVVDDAGAEVPCTDQNKKLLPAFIQQKLVRKVDDDNGLRRTKKLEEEEKN